ncbi:MAG: AraC family transcriptional regulator [Bacteroidota bacterium]
MTVDLQIPDLLTALIAGGGVVLALGVGLTLVLRRGEAHRANRWFGGFLIAGGLTLLSEVLMSLELYRLSNHFWITPLLYTFALGPLLYGFARTRLDSSWRLGRSHIKHAILPIYQIGHEWITGFAPLSFKSWFWQTPYAQAYGMLETWVFAISFGSYLFAISRRLQDTDEAPDRRWLMRLIRGAVVILAVAILMELLFRLGIAWEGPTDWIQLGEALAYSALLYWAVVTGWTHTLPRHPVAPPPPVERQETYGITDDALTRHTNALRQLVESERPYLDPDLTLPALAMRLGLGDKELSYVLNAGLGTGYTDYINGLRVQEAKRRLSDAAHAEATVLQIGLDAGFASKATFNRVFKRITGQTPSAFRASHDIS